MQEIYISVDIETSGPIPGIYSMLSLGACAVGDITKQFYVELKPISDEFVKHAMDIVGLPMTHFQENGVDASEAMERFSQWIDEVSNGSKPVFVAFNATFDWSFVNWYFHRFQNKNPFGISGLDIKAYYMGASKCTWADTSKDKLPASVKGQSPHTHNALDDAIEQAEIFEKLLCRN